jgi:hypothetical protein
MKNQPEKQTANPMENPTGNQSSHGIDWLWILWALLYSAGFLVLASWVSIPNAPQQFFFGLIALASLKYLIRFDG